VEIIRIENLSFAYPGAEKNALENISLAINSGEFVVICGETGCGKTTLLKMLKRELKPFGECSGNVFYCGVEISKLSDRTSAEEIAFVLQNPEEQIVTDKVWHELAFGLENLGMPNPIIRRRVGETASYFGIEEWFNKDTHELSGGQKQMLNLAGVLAMSPKLLILDEPSSQLDPIAAGNFIATLQKLNMELGLTILLTEHRLEEVFPIADRAVVMESGRILFDGKPQNVGDRLRGHKMSAGLPSAMRIYQGLSINCPCPLTVREGREFLSSHFSNKKDTLEVTDYPTGRREAVELKDVWFKYSRNEPDTLKGLSLKIYQGEGIYILGGNGTGKTTVLNVISGLNKAYRGKVTINGKSIEKYKDNSLYRHNIAYLPQNPQAVFLKDTVGEDFEEICRVMEYGSDESQSMIDAALKKTGTENLIAKHPYDLSGGEQQKCALAKMLLLKPKILLLDEPTKGIDAFSKLALANILRQLKAEGMTIVTVTHDIEFAALNADRCALLFDGEIITNGTPREFFCDNNFYTTAASRISRHMFKNAVSCDDVIKICRLNGEI